MSQYYTHAQYDLSDAEIDLGQHEQLRYLQGDAPEIHVRHGAKWFRVPLGGILATGKRSVMAVRSPYNGRSVRVVLGLGVRSFDAIPQPIEADVDGWVGNVLTGAQADRVCVFNGPINDPEGDYTVKVNEMPSGCSAWLIEVGDRPNEQFAPIKSTTDYHRRWVGSLVYPPNFKLRGLAASETPKLQLDLRDPVRITVGRAVMFDMAPNSRILMSGRVMPRPLPQ